LENPFAELSVSAGDERLDTHLGRGLEPSHINDLLRHSLRYGSPPPERQVFVNRTLRLETIRHVGFDLDFTLADYEREPMERVTLELAAERLISGHGYPEAVRRVKLRPEFPRRGLLIDKEAGTVLRMNRHRYVGRAYLGRRRLGRSEMIRLYRHEPLRPASERFYHVDSLFELPETNLYSELVELKERYPSLGLPGYQVLFEDVRNSIDWVHASGDLKAKVLAEPSVFLERDPELGLALLRLALGRRKLILLTNSEWSYADGICRYLFDQLLPGLESWRQLFDLVVVSSGKPHFFREQRDFVQLDQEGRELRRCEAPEWGGVYQGGCLDGLMQLLSGRGERVLYVGDHIYGDIVTSKRESTWRTVLIVRELEEEFHKRATLAYEMEQLTDLERRLAEAGHRMDQLHDVATLYRKALAKRSDFPDDALETIRERFADIKDHHHNLLLRASRLGDRIAKRFNPYWGSFFKQGSSKTLFAHQLEAFACLYTSRVSNLGLYGTNHYFRVIEDLMMHEVEGE
jgi:HAD superfamily 5'-nucleotidase-like hydrolase